MTVDWTLLFSFLLGVYVEMKLIEWRNRKRD
jgi:hypothetical protein